MLLSLYPKILFGRITTIHNALKGSVPPYINKHAKEKGQRIRLFTDSGFSYKKGTDQIIDAFMRLFKEGENVELSIAGDIKEEEKAYWDKRIQSVKESCGESFRQLGYQDSVLPFMQQADIFISASLSEGCSNSRILALCMGIPIITTDNGAIIDYPFPKTNVAFVPIGNPVMIARCIRGIFRNLSSGQGEMSCIEREQRLQYFSIERERKEWVTVINKVLER
jgi:glycosyltransferase involved in cell wall biosynthesis